MKKYLSFGGGVNSTALLLLLRDEGEKFEPIFVNHGTDWPETYQYIEYLKFHLLDFNLTEIKPNYQGYSNLYDYCKAKKFLPSIYLRWCTYRFKLQPLWDYVEKPCIMYIGISAEEKHRILVKQPKGITGKWPLVEKGITRNECIKIIRDSGLEVPVKSGCYICPFQSKKQLRKLYAKHPNLFEKVVELEKIRGNRHTLKEKPITYYVAYNTKKLDDLMLREKP